MSDPVHIREILIKVMNDICDRSQEMLTAK